MSSYSVAEAKNGLPSLIDKALAGEEVVITRRGREVVELRPRPVAIVPEGNPHDWLDTQIAKLPKIKSTLTSVELLDLVYQDYRY